MSNNGHNTEPNFKAIMGLMPGMMSGFAKNKGVPVAMPAIPTLPKSDKKKKIKRCIVDHKFFGGLFTGDPIDQVIDGVCPACLKQLKAGWTAFVCDADKRSLMLRPKSGVSLEYTGKIVKVSVEQMDQMWAKAKGEL